MKHFIHLLFLLFISSSVAQVNSLLCRHFDEAGRTRERLVDFESMVLHIDFNTTSNQVFGNVKYQFTPIRKEVSTLILDAPGITINEVLLDGVACEFEQNDKELIIVFASDDNPNGALHWENQHSLEIDYFTTPKKGIYFYGWDDTTNRAKKQIWTQGQGIDNRYWIPSFDDVSDKLITETYITFDNGYEVISNGDLIEKIPVDQNKTTWHYKMQQPHVVYLVMIAIGEYDYKDIVSKNGVVSRQYYYKDAPEQFDYTYKYSAEMMDFMEKEFGVNYPWGKIYRNVPVANFLYGAMENTTSTIFTDLYLKDSRTVIERSYVGTNAHELTHQWFGDYITEWNSTSHWLHESFATQYAKHFKKSLYANSDEYDWERYQEMKRGLRADEQDDLPIAHSKSGSARHYPKGSFIIDMLRDAAGGEEQYQKVITNYLKKYGFKHVDTHLFQMEFMETLGLNLDWFFDQWIYKGAFPHFEISYQIESDSLQLNVTQIQEMNTVNGVFKVDVPCAIYYKDGTSETLNLNIENDSVVFNFPLNGAFDFFVFDEGNIIYKKITFERSTEELLSQAKNAKHMIDRYFALQALEDVDIKDKRNQLIEIYDNETFYATKSNIVKQLVKDDNKKSQKVINKAILDENYNVRMAAIYHNNDISKKQLALYETLLTDSSFSVIEQTLVKLSKTFPENTASYLNTTKADASKNNLFKIIWLYVAIKNGDEKLIDDLVDFSSLSFEFRTRIKAMKAIDDLEIKNENYIKNLINGSVSFNGYLARTSRKYLTNLVSDEAIKTKVLEIIDNTTFDKNEQERINIFLSKIEEDK